MLPLENRLDNVRSEQSQAQNAGDIGRVDLLGLGEAAQGGERAPHRAVVSRRAARNSPGALGSAFINHFGGL